jgi:primosomal protein N' (replication factor Y)
MFAAMVEHDETQQLSLLPVRAPRRRVETAATAPEQPVAVVQVDTGLPHLDRPFDYLVPADLDADVRPGVRVKVRFAGRDLDGFVLERRAQAEHTGRLAPIRRVVSVEPVLSPTLLTVCREVARRSAGTLGDVLRLAIPPRHAAAERALPEEVTAPPWPPVGEAAEGTEGGDGAGAGTRHPAGAWADHVGGAALLTRLEAGESPSASLLVLPSTDPRRQWAQLLVEACDATLRSGRGAIVVLPDARDVDRVESAVLGRFGRGHHVRLTADQGPQARYTAWLKARRGQVRLVIGTRAAVHAPVVDLGLIAWWDDGDDSHVEPRSPYAHVRTVARVRSEVEGCALLPAGHTRSVAVAELVTSGLLKDVQAPRALVRDRTARLRVAGEGADAERDPTGGRARLPRVAWEAAREGLAQGPVLVQVPRRGYLPALSCDRCRRRARCPACAGPLALERAGSVPQCRWCGRIAARFECPHCGSARLRSAAVGAARTAEELGRTFPGVPVLASGGREVVDGVDHRPRLVVATPGAEPVATEGYAAALLLDAWALLDRPDLDAGEECVRRWTGAVALVRPRRAGGVAVLCGVPSHVTLPAVEALVRWDPAWFAERELAERALLRLPPAAVVGTLTGTHADLTAATEGAPWPASARVLGPLPTSEGGPERLIVSADPADREALTALLRQVRSRWAAGRRGEPVTVRIDPQDPLA